MVMTAVFAVLKANGVSSTVATGELDAGNVVLPLKLLTGGSFG